MEILKVENLSKTYSHNAKVLSNINLTINKGEFIAIMGASGSGKSTLLHMLGGVDTATSGKVIVEGTDISQLNKNQLTIFRRKNIGIVYQFYNLIPTLNVEDNITLPLLLDKQKINKEKLTNILQTLNLIDRRKYFPNQLSGGQQQRVAIGRALIMSPSIILADEPTGNLDSKNSEEIMNLLKICNKQYQQTLIIVTHDENIAKQANKIITIKDGMI